MPLSRYIFGIFLILLLLSLLLLPVPSSAGPAGQEGDDTERNSTPQPPDEPAVDWANVRLGEERDSYLPQRETPPPAATPSGPGERLPDPGNVEASSSATPPAPVVEAAAPANTSTEGSTTYVVQRGDTIYELAQRYGLTMAALVAANSLADPGKIVSGQVLVIPVAAATTPLPAGEATAAPLGDGNAYSVRPGDNPYRIARRFDVPLLSLMEFNHITNPKRLKVGQVLIIPGPGVTPPPTPATEAEITTAAATAPAADGVASTEGSYVVQVGDTLYEIAGDFGTTVLALTAANNIPNPNQLEVGKVLTIVGPEAAGTGTPLAAPSPPPPPPPTPSPPEPTVEETPVPADTGFIWPVEGGTISQYYRYGHRAIDILLPVGTPIVAAADGVVEFAGWNNYGYGWLIILDHGNGYRTLYAHQSDLLVVAEQEVKQGELIGKSGHTGWSTHPHLHFEILLNYAPKDPCSYLPGGC